MPLNNPAPALHIDSGTYTGNNVDNREISHNLGVIPKMIIITGTTEDPAGQGFLAGSDYFIGAGNGEVNAVTARTALVFYVPYEFDKVNLNGTSREYSWVAIG